MLLSLLILTCFFGNILTLPAADSTTTQSTVGIDFFKILPRKAIEDLAAEHLKNDEGFRAAMKYMKGEEFNKIMDDLSKKEEWVKLKGYLNELNINVDVPINCLRAYLKNITIKGDTTAKMNLEPFIIEVSKVVPTSKIVNAWHAKISEPGFGKLFEKMSSDESKKIVIDALNTAELKKLMTVLADMGLNIKDGLKVMFAAMGWGDVPAIN